MRITAAVLTLAAAGAFAAPSPKPAPVPWCWRPGEPCFKVKRVADAFAEAIKTSGGLKEREPEAEYSNSPGGAAHIAKRLVNELAHLSALTAREPDQYYRDLGMESQFERDEPHNEKRDADADAAPEPWCWRPGQSCWKRDPSNDPVPVKDKRWCHRPGQSCWKAKRAAEAVVRAVEDDSHDDGGDAGSGNEGGHFPDICNGPGILCWKKRSAAPNPDAEPEAEPEAEPWCWRPGQPCWKRSASPDPAPKPEPWCWRPGQSCWKAKREAEPKPDPEAEPWCWRPGQPCWKAKRDLQALHVAARNILNTFE
ncbi:clock-controlled pheromone ccg-4 precursor [Pochonia chlamydosporia 170]|uniref:Clock-controlled pheromone ccg-4 n=1 Tax=Pochonia chlamydosporia 170 TaxID=1380566 RepID=A0A179G2A4_METCM|nr:clock-controlled pheromone ccg-4 precursor [Pochonia chlamydosporia 170]OAQ71329.1 clock-controlled pheromone ccg-4 precursor [Pochonia chlamydosporia 170]